MTDYGDADLVVIVPSRGRPHAVAEVAKALEETSRAATEVLFIVDDDDPTRAGYVDAVAALDAVTAIGGSVDLVVGEHRNMGDALNKRAWRLAAVEASAPFAVGFCGDDHRFRSVGWDQAYLDALRELGTGIVYGNDLLQGPNLPTQVAMTSDIIRTLGHMAPSTLVHLYLDQYWKDLGQQAGCLRYLPNVVVEHLHPVAGKAQWDEGYLRVNAQSMYARDHAAYMQWRYTQMPAEVEKVRALRAARAVAG